MLYQRSIGGKNFVLECDVLLEPMGKALLEKLDALNALGPSLQEGSRIQYGWSVLTLQKENDCLRICEPAFYGDALNNFSPRIDTTLAILQEQALVLQRTGLKGLDVSFSDEVFVRNNALEAPNLFLRRQQPGREGDSGWYIGNLDDMDASAEECSSESVRVFMLLQRRSVLLQVLTLPVDTLVVVSGDTITEILDVDGKNLWN